MQVSIADFCIRLQYRCNKLFFIVFYKLVYRAFVGA